MKLKWDGKKDYIELLANTVQTANQELFKRVLKKWLVAMVACALGIRENHTVLILSGDQGLHKSTWLRSLLPSPLNGYLSEEIMNPHDKDYIFNVIESLLVNLDELEAFNNIDLLNLKSIVTSTKFRKRRPYARFPETYIRRASFMGSVNDLEFLTDMSGNRRFLCFKVEKQINTDHGINMDDVFAQAYWLLTKKTDGVSFRYWFDKAEEAEIENNNSTFYRMDIEEELVLKYFEVPTSDDLQLLISPTDMVYYINKHEGYNAIRSSNLRKLGRALKKHGFTKKSERSSKPYRVKLKQVIMKDPLFGRTRET